MTARVAKVAKHLLADVRPEPFRPNRACAVLDSYIAYVERPGKDKDKCIVFLHGNPANSYLWRKVANEVEGKVPHRLLAPDLIGFGRSGDSKHGYDFFTHYSVVKEKEVVLCIHDWGSALGFHWFKNHPKRVRGIVHMESLVGPMENWNEFPAKGRKVFQNMREDEGAGEAMVLEKNFFLERLLLGEPWAAKLGDEGCAPYRERFNSEANRAPTLYWPRQIPIRGTNGPKAVIDAAQAWMEFLQSSDVPKVFVPATPGFFTPVILEKVKGWRNHKVAKPVNGIHFLQEESGEEIGKIVHEFVNSL